jgi:dolichol-phosphate mannosyltransferase
MKDAVVIIPTYNEIENIEAIVRAVFSESRAIHILIVDDGSPDGTSKKVMELQQEFEGRLHLKQREKKLGLGTAYILGFNWSLVRSYQYIFEMDADFSHNPKDLKRLYAACADEGADMSIGSRYLTGVNVVNWPMSRVLMSYMASNMCVLLRGCILMTLQRVLCATSVAF